MIVSESSEGRVVWVGGGSGRVCVCVCVGIFVVGGVVVVVAGVCACSKVLVGGNVEGIEVVPAVLVALVAIVVVDLK